MIKFAVASLVLLGCALVLILIMLMAILMGKIRR